MEIKAVEMVRKIRDKHYQETKGMTLSEQIKYINKKAAEFRKRLKKKKHPIATSK
jgi:hypothetical protein